MKPRLRRAFDALVAFAFAALAGAFSADVEAFAATAVEADSSRRAAAAAPQAERLPAQVASVAGFGDSITVGRGASEDSKRWLNRVAASLGAGPPVNRGRSGSVLQNSPDAEGTPRPKNGRDRYASALLGRGAAELIVIAYGFNDARYVGNPRDFNVAAYVEDYREVLGGLIGAGHPRNRIVVVTPHYIGDVGLKRGTRGFAGQSRAGFEAYVEASRTLADEFGVYWADSYSAMKAAALAGQDIFSRDQIHPNDLGHEIIAKAVLDATRRPDR